MVSEPIGRNPDYLLPPGRAVLFRKRQRENKRRGWVLQVDARLPYNGDVLPSAEGNLALADSDAHLPKATNFFCQGVEDPSCLLIIAEEFVRCHPRGNVFSHLTPSTAANIVWRGICPVNGVRHYICPSAATG